MACPTCSTTRLYRLADGRLKCSLCRKVFTIADQRHHKLSVVVRTGLATAFWQMEGAGETASRLDLNIKTVQKYFGLLRDHLAFLSTQGVASCCGMTSIPASRFAACLHHGNCGPKAQPIAAVIRTKTGLNLLQVVADQPDQQTAAFPEVLGWLYAQDEESRQRLALDRIHCQAVDSSSLTLTAPFWRFVKQGMVHYQGGFRHHFFQYLHEMEFRYNDRQTGCGPELCIQFLTDV